MLKVDAQDDYINTLLLIVKTEIILTVISFPMKYNIGIERPDSTMPAQFQSFPSWHTAQAFAAASIVHKEFRHKSQWYGIGAYTIATAVGAFRMLNNRHWELYVFAGAGVGILSAHIAYLTHKYKWGRKFQGSVMPIYNYRSLGLSMSLKL